MSAFLVLGVIVALIAAELLSVRTAKSALHTRCETDLTLAEPGGTITLRLSRPSRSVLLTVDDSGPGFSEEVLGGFYRRSVLCIFFTK